MKTVTPNLIFALSFTQRRGLAGHPECTLRKKEREKERKKGEWAGGREEKERKKERNKCNFYKSAGKTWLPLRVIREN